MSALEDEIGNIARVGLHPGEIARRQRQSGDFPTLLALKRVSEAGLDLETQALTLVQLLVEAAKSMPQLDISAMSQALLGVEMRSRDWPYDRRRAMAVSIWDPDGKKSDGSFTRRVLPKIRRALANSVMELAKHERGRERALGRTATIKDQFVSIGLKRISVRAESWLTGARQQSYQTEWTYRDRATRDGVDSVKVRKRAANTVSVEPITDSIEAIEPLGVGIDGFSIWRVRFREPLDEGQEVEWGTRTVYESLEAIDDRWLSITVSHAHSVGAIEQGTFIVHFDPLYPVRAYKFVTPKGTLPELVGPYEELHLGKERIGRAHFTKLEPWQSYGIRWFPAKRFAND